MDQLKQALGQAAKHQFWIVTALAVVLGIVGFFMASSTLNDLYTKQKTAIDTNYSNLQTVASAVSTHPNDQSQEQMAQIIDTMAEDVRAAWESQWQRQAPLLKWPKDIPLPRLIEKLEALYPIELKLEYPAEPANIVESEKRAYKDYQDQQMPRLAEIIGVTWVGEARAAAAGGMGGMGMGGMGMGGMEDGGMGMGGMGMGGMGMGGMGMEGEGGGYPGTGGGYPGTGGGYGMSGYPGTGMAGQRVTPDLVVWPKSSQDELLTSIRMWRGPLPSVYEIVYTQENMWLLEGLLNIIKRTNGDAIANFQTTVREIEFIRIGKIASGDAGDIIGASSGGMGGMGGMGYGMGGMGMEDGGEGDGGMNYGMEGESKGGGLSMAGPGTGDMGGGVATVTSDPADGRYVDAAFKPITGDDLRMRMRSQDPSDAYFAVAKRVPVRMRLKIDQRKTHELLANCANADLMLEVHQVRLGDTRPAGRAGGGGGMDMGGMGMGGMGMGMGGMMGPGGGGMEMGGGDKGGGGFGMEGDGGMGMEGMGMGGMGMGGMGMGGMMGRTASKDPWLITIEIYGVMTLFNPVNIEHLGLNKVTEDTEIDSTVDTPAVIDEPQTELPADGGTPPGDGTAADAGTTGSGTTGSGAAGSEAADGTSGPANGNPANGNPAGGANAGTSGNPAGAGDQNSGTTPPNGGAS